MSKNILFLILIVIILTNCRNEITPDFTQKPNKPFGKVVSLNGEWQIAEGGMEIMPSTFPSVIPVPGLLHLAKPEFKEVGLPGNIRNAFWYKRTFQIEGKLKKVVLLKIGKAMYGTKVFVNGKEACENLMSFSPTVINIAQLLNDDNVENELVVRIGAHISVLPNTVTAGGEAEKIRYIPGIYDDVELIIPESTYYITTQVAPDVENELVKVALYIKNYEESRNADFSLNVYDSKTKELVGSTKLKTLRLIGNDEKTEITSIKLKNMRLWTPEVPNLYVLEVNDGNDNCFTRFGMRQIKTVNGETNRVLLNGSPYFFRGNNIAIGRFYEDPECKSYPWDTVWVRKLIRTFKSTNLNSTRLCVGSPPMFWYDIMDEEGFAVFDEYPLWYAYRSEMSKDNLADIRNEPFRKNGIWPEGVTTEQMAKEYSAFMKEHWNHACVLFWDAQNETWAPETKEAINIVRSLDLSNRPWDNGWTPPAGKNDIREAHDYWESYNVGNEGMKSRKDIIKPFSLADVPNHKKIPSTFYLPYQFGFKDLPLNWYWDYPVVLNEYSYLWLRRDGNPTQLTKPFYDAVLGADATPAQRRNLYARYLAAVTEWWRASRTCFGILYPFGLAHSFPGCYTSDNFIDIDKLQLDEYYLKYVPDAFSPLGVCIDYWKDKHEKDEKIEIPVVITNDIDSSFTGNCVLKLILNDETIWERKKVLEVNALGQQSILFKMETPPVAGKYQLIAEIEVKGKKIVKSYRDIVITNEQMSVWSL